MDRDLVRGLSEKEVEIEHLRTQIVALSEKAEVLADMRTDVSAHRQMLRSSEDHRLQLQTVFTETSERVRQDTVAHQEYQQRLINDNESLRSELNEARQQMGSREQEHLQRVEEQSRANHVKLDALTRQHFDTNTLTQNAHLARLESLQSEHKEKLDKLTQESNDKIDALTREKDSKLEA